MTLLDGHRLLTNPIAPTVRKSVGQERFPRRRMGKRAAMNKHRAMSGITIGLVATAVVIGIAVSSVHFKIAAAAHVATVDTAEPTSFYPQSTLFCNVLHEHGVLQRMVDNFGIGSTASASIENANLLMLKVVVEASPDQPTRTAMVGLYRDILTGDSHSSAAQSAISTVEVMNSCALHS